MDKFMRVEIFSTKEDPKSNITYLNREVDSYLDLSKKEDKEQYNFVIGFPTRKGNLYFEPTGCIFRFVPIDSMPVGIQ